MISNLKRLGLLLLMVIFGLLTVIGFTGCATTPDAVTPDPDDPDDNVIVIGYASPTYDLSDGYGQLEVGFKEYLDAYGEEHGIEFQYIAKAPESHSGHQEQYAIVQDMLQAGVDFMVIGPTSWEGQIGSYNLVMEAGIPLIVVNFSEKIEGIDAIRWTAYSHADAGALTAQNIKENYPPGTKMAIIHGVPGAISIGRSAVDVHLANGMEIVYEEWCDFNREKAYYAVERLLEAYPEVEIINAVSSAMAVGAIEAVDAAGRLDEISIYGAGGTIEELDALWAGRLTGVWLRDPITWGASVGEAIAWYLEGRHDELAETVEYNIKLTWLQSRQDIIDNVHPITYESVGRDFPTLD